jgi:predicted helicase
MVHFYETFLAAYDPRLRELRGNYYTPDAVVDFIVRAVDDLLVRDFGKKEGLADKTVRLLDPATGTATFLARAYRTVRETMTERGDGALWPDRAREHVAQHFYGFELIPAAYTLAHLKLRQLLAELDAPLPDKTRLPVYLTNTLEEGNPPQNPCRSKRSSATRCALPGRSKSRSRFWS